MKAKPPAEERWLILANPRKRPYGARLKLHVQSALAFGEVEEVCALLSTGALATITADPALPWLAGARYTVEVEGFRDGASAETTGRRVATALLWSAVKLRIPLRFEYFTPEPSTVFDRNQAVTITSSSHAATGWPTAVVLDEFHRGFDAAKDVEPSLSLSMEISAGARLEASERARFLACVSALEPLCGERRKLGNETDEFVKACVDLLSTGLTSSSWRSFTRSSPSRLRKCWRRA